MRTLPAVLASCWFLFVAACGRSGVGPPAVRVTALRAEPSAFAPGDTVRLLPEFPDGTARIDPDVGPVTSGDSYVVGPVTAGRRYTLTVTRSGSVDTVVLDVPLRYRERVRELAPPSLARTRHGATTLADGQALLVGGASPTPLFWATAERWNPIDRSLTPVGDLSGGRSESAVVAMPDGSAFALGGPINLASFELATRVEQWDPAALAWSVRGNLFCNRIGMTATRLADDTLLVVGGTAFGGTLDQRDAELFAPGLGARSPAGQALAQRAGHTATLLADGTVWIAGGVDPSTGALVPTTERYDPATETFAADATLLFPRSLHAAVALADGTVLLLGGDGVTGPVATAERYDPATATTVAAGDLVTPRGSAEAVLLLDGSVLTAGGVAITGATDRIEVWQPTTGTWREWSNRLPAPRTGHSLHVAPDGTVALLGGDIGSGFPQPTHWLLD